MNYNIIVTEKFSKALKRLKKKYKNIKDDFQKCIELLEENPHAGVSLGKRSIQIKVETF